MTLPTRGAAARMISVVVPSYNQGPFIEETLRSIVEQDYDNFELIVMDGGSSDETVSIIERYSHSIAFWVSAKDGGQADALDRGFQRARGDIFCWVNSDDALAPGALTAVAAAFDVGDADIVAGVVDVVQDGKLIYHHRTGQPAGRIPSEVILDLEHEWLTGRFFYQPEVFFTRRIYDAAGGRIDRSLTFSMDYDLWVRLARAGARLMPVDRTLARFRLHPDQKTSRVAAYLPELTAHAEAARITAGLPPVSPSAAGGAGKRTLRVGMLNDHGFRYGAGRAHRRAAECLAASHVDVFVFAFREGLDDRTDVDIGEAVTAFRACAVDVIVVGNLHGAFPQGLDLGPLADVAPLLIVTHDNFWFTGRCPYPMGCEAYLGRCPPTCPSRDSYPVIDYDAIPAAHARKLDALALPNVFVAANSAFMERRARAALAAHRPDLDLDRKIRRLHLPVPESAFRPGDRAAERAALGLGSGELVVLTVSASVNDSRKRFAQVVEACRLAKRSCTIRLLALGQVAPDDRLPDITYLGYVVDDEAIARYYRAADVFVSASADETFGQTFVEAALCGCPSLAFAVGAIPEVVVEGETGWLLHDGDVVGLASRLCVLAAEDRHSRDAARLRAHLHADRRFRTPTFVAGINDIFRDIVRNDDVAIATGVQFGGTRVLAPHIVTRRRVTLGAGFGPVEGPFPAHDALAAVQWQLAPQAVLTIHTPRSEVVMLTLRVANIYFAQTVAIARGDEVLARIDLPAEEWLVHHEIDIAIDLPAGDTILRTEAPAGLDVGERMLHLAFYQSEVASTDASPGVRDVRRIARDRPAGAVAGEGFAALEGPYPDLDVHRPFRWQTMPQATVRLRPPSAGVFLVRLRFANPFQTQTIVLSRDGRDLAHVDCEAGELSIVWEIALALQLPFGETALIVTAAGGRDADDRRLHLALFDARLESATIADGLRWHRRVGRDGDGHRAATSVVGESLQPDLYVGDGFAACEGPYPALGVPYALCWQIERTAWLCIRTAPDATAIAIDLRVPCEQAITAVIDGRVHTFTLAEGSWERPARLVLPLHGVRTWRQVELTGHSSLVDGAGRALRLALIGAKGLAGEDVSAVARHGVGTVSHVDDGGGR